MMTVAKEEAMRQTMQGSEQTAETAAVQPLHQVAGQAAKKRRAG